MASTSVVVNQAPTNLGPLTTVFTAPPECTAAVAPTDGGLLGLGLLGGGVGNVALLGQTCANGDPADATACWPPVSSGVQVPDGGRLGGFGFYSPGLDCPAGHAAACTATGGAGGDSQWPVQFQLRDGETALGCCPSGFGCDNINGQTCIMTATSTEVAMVTCQGDKTGKVATQTVPDEKASITAFSMLAPMIQLNFQSSDLPAQKTSDAPPPPVGGGAAGKTDPPPPPPATESNGAPPPPSTSNDAGAAAATSNADAPPPPPAQATSSTQAGAVPPPQQTNAQPTEAGNTQGSGGGSAAQQTEGQAQQDSSGNGSSNDDKDNNDGGVGSLSKAATMGIFIGGGSAALLAIASAVIFYIRRRRKVKEESELDRLYGLDKLDSSTGLSRADQFPGFSYRGNAQGGNF